MAGRWLQDLGRAATVAGPAAEAKVRRLLTLLGGRLPHLGGLWEQLQLLMSGAPP